MENSLEKSRISVRNLVEFIYRSGDIDNRVSGAREKQAMDAGRKIHKKLQKQMGSTYESEVSLKYTAMFDTGSLLIEGRADGIFSEEISGYLSKVILQNNITASMKYDDKREAGDNPASFLRDNSQRRNLLWTLVTATDSSCLAKSDTHGLLEESGNTSVYNLKESKDIVVVDEIKGMYKDIKKLKSPISVHKAQAMCYAYIYALQNAQKYIGVQMTYANLDNEEIKRFYYMYSTDELYDWFMDLLLAYKPWIEIMWKHQNELIKSIKNMKFPFEYRKGQRKLAVAVYKSIEARKELFVQAPTGIGKTMSVLYPSLKAIGEGYSDRVFYLTAKTITRTVARDAFNILKNKGLKIHYVTITAKEKICHLEKCTCNPVDCEYAKGHFDRVNDAIYDVISHEYEFDRETIIEYSEKYKICPFEFNLDLSLWSQGIICDYNYVYDPNVYLRRFFGDSATGKNIFLTDEAHNLVDRAREMYSAKIVKEDILKFNKFFKKITSEDINRHYEEVFFAKKIIRILNKLNKILLEYKKELKDIRILDLEEIKNIYDNTFKLQESVSAFLEDTKDVIPEDILNIYFEIRHFNLIYENINENYVFYCSLKNAEFVLTMLCVNPAKNISEVSNKAVSSIYFSATMLPMAYYKELLTANEEAYSIYVETPFDKNKRLIAISSDISSKYSMRTQKQYDDIYYYIKNTLLAKKGNYIVFFPSYQYLKNVLEVYNKDNSYCDFDIVVQKPDMTEIEREEFIENFKEENKKTLAGFCVIGGIFSEGIDLTGEKLIGAIIIGTGLSNINIENEQIKKYFNDKGKDGYDYAYRYSGINKVFQAAGRVIRTDKDEGVIVLLDYRMLFSNHVRLFPMDWDNYVEVNKNNYPKILKMFWEYRESEKIENKLL